MKNRYARFFLISLGVFLCDQATKYLVRSHLGLSEVIPVFPFFSIVYIDNTGSAFGMLKSLGNSFFIGVSSLAIIVIAVMIMRVRENRLALSLILGGAAGNMADRILHGYVVDFLDFYAGVHHWPAFNIADAALTVGIAFLVITTTFHKHDTERSRA